MRKSFTLTFLAVVAVVPPIVLSNLAAFGQSIAIPNPPNTVNQPKSNATRCFEAAARLSGSARDAEMARCRKIAAARPAQGPKPQGAQTADGPARQVFN